MVHVYYFRDYSDLRVNVTGRVPHMDQTLCVKLIGLTIHAKRDMTG